jgi:hypothetical protein
MPKLTDQLKKPRLRSAVKGEVPEWWPAAQIIAGGALAVAFAVMTVTHFGSSSLATTTPTTLYTAITAAPITAPVATVPATSVPGSLTTNPQGSTPADSVPSTGSMPVSVDGVTVAVALAEGGTKAIPSAAWVAVKENITLVHPNSSITGATLLQSSGTSNVFSVSISNAAEEPYAVQVTAVLQSNGIWTAN